MLVYVLNKDGKPLMPTSRCGKVAYLLKHKLAKVVRRTPFTIQLLYESKEYTQPIALGVDTGSKIIGISATTEKKVLFEAEVKLRTDIVENLSTRREARRVRRFRKTRYRKPRFDNRIASKKEGWLAPSIIQKIQTHLSVIALIHRILPIFRIIVETAQFDIQKIKNPEIQGIEYQQGEQFGFWNVREYVLFRDNHVCQHCKGKNKILNVHHIESRKVGGDSPNNLITLCEDCHKKYHRGEIKLKIKLKIKRGASFKDSAFMSIMRPFLLKELKSKYPRVQNTYGYLTKHTRIQNSLPKEHYVDARCISGNPLASPSILYKLIKNRKHNRQIHKFTVLKGGIRKLNQSPFKVFGFRLNDKVKYRGMVCFIAGRRLSGSFTIKDIEETLIKDGITYKKLRLLEKVNSFKMGLIKKF